MQLASNGPSASTGLRLACPFVHIDQDSDFPLENLPFGIFSTLHQTEPRACTRVGDFVLDLSELARQGVFSGPLLQTAATRVFAKETLNAFIELGRPAWRECRSRLQGLLSQSAATTASLLSSAVHSVHESGLSMHLPIAIGDYTDFYASKEHATNVGTMFRGAENALNPNWQATGIRMRAYGIMLAAALHRVHMPIGYHGRASSIVVSGTPIRRPWGQIKPKEGAPYFGPCQKLDIELEMAFVVGRGNALGVPIPIEQASDYIFGMVLMNDWSARDIQAWEYVPLGPFLGKNFGTSISPWIVTLDALDPFLTAGPVQEPKPLAYLQEPSGATSNYDVELQVALLPNGESQPSVLCASNLKHMYWSIRQQLAHHSVNGCNLRVGDLCGTGTLSGPTPSSMGSMLELSWNGSKAIELKGSPNKTRMFLEDGDTVALRGFCQGKEYRIGFGECSGQIVPAHAPK